MFNLSDCSIAQVNITINDVNDNAPEFDSASVKISVPENTEINTTIYAAHARDADSSSNGVIVYRLFNDPSGMFRIDERLGAVLLVKKLDFESTAKYTLTIQAQDKGTPPLRSANLTLNVEVQDVNDNSPTFEKSEYSVNVPESLAVNSQFIQVTAFDLDTGNNARITYRIEEDAPDNVFGIFPNSGSLYLKKSLDRELRDRYTLTVTAMDNGMPPASAHTVVRVNVLDANDNDPSFSHEVYHFKIEENLSKGSVVGVVLATDPDVDANAALRYSLLTSDGNFELNAISG